MNGFVYIHLLVWGAVVFATKAEESVMQFMFENWATYRWSLSCVVDIPPWSLPGAVINSQCVYLKYIHIYIQQILILFAFYAKIKEIED